MSITTDELRAVLREATAHPWAVLNPKGDDGGGIVSTTGERVLWLGHDGAGCSRAGEVYHQADHILMILAPTLAAEVLALRERVAGLEAEVAAPGEVSS